MASSIASSLTTCRIAFNNLIEDMHVSGKEKLEGLFVPDWEDERGRLRMWAANIGAHQTGQSSLDFRLRDSSQIQQQIIRLLENLAVQLEEAGTVLTEGEDSDVESINGSDSGNEESQSELQQLRSNIASLISCLFEISILVRKPARHDVRIGSKDIDLAAYEWADRRHVKDKFPTADDEIVSRLGHAITHRRKYLRYRERHTAKLRQGIDRGIEQDGQPSRSEVLSETIATDVRNRGVDNDVDDNGSDSGFTQTSYASTLISGSRITVPTAPEASRSGAPFECPYCYCIVTAPNLRSWSRHVFNDLEPYVCTDMDCKTPNKLYTTRHEWLHHMKIAHRHHENETHECTLCGDHQRDQASLGRHVARHLQELALFILPRNEADADEDVSDAKAAASSNRSSLDYGYDLPSTITSNDATCDAIAVEDSAYLTVNEAKSDHAQRGEEKEEDESEDDEGFSVIDEKESEEGDGIPSGASSKDYQAEEDSTNTTSQLQLPRRGRTERLEAAIPNQKERETELSGENPSRKQPLYYADDNGMLVPPTTYTVGQSDSRSKGMDLWFCGWCRFGPMRIVLHDHCVACHRPKNGWATVGSSGS
ncbi:MAG: hypothetical protein L6R42_006038 [Xanthoria sp. 1 TBL-2021]|nr:MAG: hypothetical protein L6R42_006038 [Xanthoria sp. 1 TBL-2021]